MFNPQSITGVETALIAGLVTSLHCVGMCGPVACLFAGSGKAVTESHLCQSIYHAMRLLSYACIGALAGGLGKAPFERFSDWSLFPWAVAFFFIAVGFGWDRFLPKPAWVGKLFYQARQSVSGKSPLLVASLVGLLTPLLPCGPLYLMFGVALLSGSALKGAEFALAFGVGTLPLLYVAQMQFFIWQKKISPLWIERLQRGMALVMGIIVLARIVYGSSLESVATIEEEKPKCPMCPSHQGN